jgi:tRNA dimethylallyltransferase
LFALPTIAIVGPTASGKTATAIELAHLLKSHSPAEIISADSRQVFRYLDIGTAKPTREELAEIPHHFIDIKNPDEYYSAGIFGTEANSTVEDLLKKNVIPIIAGGSGLYVQALCDGFFEEKTFENSTAIRDELQDQLETEGRNALYEELIKIDPESAQLYNDKNPRRILRALEFFKTTGKKFSEAFKSGQSQRNFATIFFGILPERGELYTRINNRCVKMWNGGIIEETENVLKAGYSPELNSLNTVGYKETIAFLKGEISAEDALLKMQQNTRRYAKRQITWFRRDKRITWLDGTPEEMAKIIFKSIGFR